MKKKILFPLLFFLIIFCISDCSTYQSENNSSETNANNPEYDYSYLNNYGDWVATNYGQAWQPFVTNGWMPFDNGHWEYANGNWTWISYEPFGWIVYHYGNWYHDPVYGWVWLPSSNAWSPARVEWINYGNYICWAPMPPAGITYREPWETNQEKYWHVVKSQDFTQDNLQNYRAQTSLRNKIGARSNVQRTAPTVQDVQKSTGTSVREERLQHQRVNMPNRNKTVEKIILPPAEEKKVEENSTKVKDKVLVPKDEYKRQQNNNNRNNTNNNNNNNSRNSNNNTNNNNNSNNNNSNSNNNNNSNNSNERERNQRPRK